MQYYNLSDFLKMSSVLNCQLSTKRRNWNSITFIVLENKPIQNTLHRLNGILMSVFDQPEHEARRKQLSAICQNKAFMMEVAGAFVTRLVNFLNDPGCFVHGIKTERIHPETI